MSATAPSASSSTKILTHFVVDESRFDKSDPADALHLKLLKLMHTNPNMTGEGYYDMLKESGCTEAEGVSKAKIKKL